MKPRGMRSKWVRLLPWYYTKRHQPTRAAERESAIAADLTAACGPGLDYDRLVDLVQSLPPLEPVEPIKLTREQWDWVKPRLMPREPSPRPSCDMFEPSPLWATPIQIVATVEESTPHLKGWAGWHVVGHPDATFPSSSASVAPQPEETE